MAEFQIAINDMIAGLRRLTLCYHLAIEDLRDRYRRTMLGMLWISISFFVFVGVKALIFSQLNLESETDFLLFLTIGFALWTLISSSVNNASTCYIYSTGWILSSNTPYTVYVFQNVIRTYLDFGLIAITALLFCAVFTSISFTGLIYVPLALPVYFLTSTGFSMLLAPLSARHRDITHLVQTAMRALFFLTPIVWVPRKGTVLETVAELNPIYHYIEIVRAPLMGEPFRMDSYLITLLIAALIFTLGLYTFGRTKREIPFWL